MEAATTKLETERMQQHAHEVHYIILCFYSLGCSNGCGRCDGSDGGGTSGAGSGLDCAIVVMVLYSIVHVVIAVYMIFDDVNMNVKCLLEYQTPMKYKNKRHNNA